LGDVADRTDDAVNFALIIAGVKNSGFAAEQFAVLLFVGDDKTEV
jgi:hypothetical protein